MMKKKRIVTRRRVDGDSRVYGFGSTATHENTYLLLSNIRAGLVSNFNGAGFLAACRTNPRWLRERRPSHQSG